jgi:hypothetical protein
VYVGSGRSAQVAPYADRHKPMQSYAAEGAGHLSWAHGSGRGLCVMCVVVTTLGIGIHQASYGLPTERRQGWSAVRGGRCQRQ